MAKLNVNRFPDRDGAERYYLQKVDDWAETARLKYITSGSGQSMTYEAKHQEALSGGGLMIDAEAEALGITAQEVIDSVLLARQRWQALAVQIEAARLKAKKAIREAQTAANMHRVVTELKSQLMP